MNERTFNPGSAHRLEDPDRLLWMPPNEAIELLGLQPDMVVADIGAGTGFFALPFARAVAPAGMVWAVDLQPRMLEILQEKLRRGGAPANIELREGHAAQTGLADSSCDLAFLGNLWHELDDKESVLTEMRRLLRPAGRIAILDWRPDTSHPPGPPLNHRVAPRAVEALLSGDHWRDVNFRLFGQHSYLLVASRELAYPPIF